MHPATSWDKLCARRREKLHLTENKRLGEIEQQFFDLPNPDVLSNENSVLIAKFLTFHRSSFDPPAELLYSKLSSFLKSVALSPRLTRIVLLDERRDNTGSSNSTRLWDSESEGPDQCGYMNYPPKGSAIFTAALSVPDFKHRMTKLRQLDGLQRIIFTVNITPNILLVLVDSIANRTVPAFRSFCNRHVLFKPVFTIHFALVQTFNLEFHIPFFALRKVKSDVDATDPRILSGEQFRASRPLPLCEDVENGNYWYHEAQLSFLVTGVDEWLWTAYCFVDTYFGNELRWEKYVDEEQDPSTAGIHPLNFPIWNLRNYFLVVLEKRMAQATREWTTLVNIFEERMILYEERKPKFKDDPDLSHTEKLTSVVATIRRFRDAAASTIEAWDNFEQTQIQHLQMTGNETLRERWNGCVSNVRANVSKLKSLQSLLTRKLEHFNNIRDGFVNAAALGESSTSRRQGENIGILAKMTVIYLPVSLATIMLDRLRELMNKLNND